MLSTAKTQWLTGELYNSSSDQHVLSEAQLRYWPTLHANQSSAIPLGANFEWHVI